MPHEHRVRAWLKDRILPNEDAEDLIQEAYAKLAGMDAFDAIANPAGYFFGIVRNLLIDAARRNRIVGIDAVGGSDDLPVVRDDLDPERIASDRAEFARVTQAVEDLPPRCRRIFIMRKVEGWSQREIADRLGVSENVVENDAAEGMALVVKALGRGSRPGPKRRGR